MNNQLFAIGDIHGCFGALKNLIEQKIQLSRTDKLILLGDYIDRGNHSKEVVDYIINLQQKAFDIVPLIGNHEAMLLNAYENPGNMPLWMHNGGEKTLQSFGIRTLKELDQHYISFFKELKYYYLLDNFVFVHAGFNNEINNPYSDKFYMIWSRSDNNTHPVFQGKFIIHGHTPITVDQCQELVTMHKQTINIDTGCVYPYEGYGRLAALELNTFTLFFA